MADTYSPETELQPGDVVGDDRKLHLYSVDPGTGSEGEMVGEAWQGEDGRLYGTGLAAVLLFEPLTLVRYQMASVAADMSPLEMFHARIVRSPFLRAEVMES